MIKMQTFVADNKLFLSLFSKNTRVSHYSVKCLYVFEYNCVECIVEMIQL